MRDEKPVANPLIVLREEFDDWAVLFDPQTGNAFGLNPVSVFIWKLLDGNHTVRDVVESIREHATGVSEEAGDHITEFVDELTTRGLVGSDITSSAFARNLNETKLRLEGHFDKLPGHSDDTRTLKYEKPALVDFNKVAHGSDCAPGSGAVGQCGTGSHATAWCVMPGNAPTQSCWYSGSAAPTGCTGNGNTARAGCGDGAGLY